MTEKDIIQYIFAEEWYQQICAFFNFDQSRDREARDYLFNLRHDFDPNILFKTISRQLNQKQPIFFGAGPNLVYQLDEIHNVLQNKRETFFLTAADGASLALKIKNIIPDLIVTDLDGLDHDDLLDFIEQKVILLIHGHGDNIEKLKNLEQTIRSTRNLICTTQVDAKYPVINPGGFTDGDRSVFFCHHLAPKSQTFILLGYELRKTIGKFSKPDFKEAMPLNNKKRAKLDFCKKLLNSISERHHRLIQYYSPESRTFFK